MSLDLAIVLIAGAAGFYMAWNIGANDVANAMGTSVGSRALTLRQAVLVAAIFELAGAVLVGTHVTETVRKGIIAPQVFNADLDLYVYGMLASLIAASIWLHMATKLGLPVSTTHSIVGAVAGFGIAAAGWDALNWAKLGQIVLSWFTSPLCGGLIGFAVFRLVGKGILDAANPVGRVRRLGPLFVFATVFVIAMATIYKGLHNLSLNLGFVQALGIAGGLGLVGALAAMVVMRHYLSGKDDLELGDQYQAVERIFRYLQVMTAASVAFAHGSNDVANAVGPLSGILNVIEKGEISGKAAVPFWILSLGGVGIVVGLATWGYKVIYTVGARITELTPTRGFSAEFAAATTIIVGSRLGMPISTTHVLVGSVIGVGFARGMAALNLRVIRDIASSWLITVPLTAVLSAVLFWIFRAVAP